MFMGRRRRGVGKFGDTLMPALLPLRRAFRARSPYKFLRPRRMLRNCREPRSTRGTYPLRGRSCRCCGPGERVPRINGVLLSARARGHGKRGCAHAGRIARANVRGRRGRRWRAGPGGGEGRSIVTYIKIPISRLRADNFCRISYEPNQPRTNPLPILPSIPARRRSQQTAGDLPLKITNRRAPAKVYGEWKVYRVKNRFFFLLLYTRRRSTHGSRVAVNRQSRQSVRRKFR